MRVPFRHIAGHLVWSTSGSVWAIWRISPVGGRYVPTRVRDELLGRVTSLVRSLAGRRACSGSPPASTRPRLPIRWSTASTGSVFRPGARVPLSGWTCWPVRRCTAAPCGWRSRCPSRTAGSTSPRPVRRCGRSCPGPWACRPHRCPQTRCPSTPSRPVGSRRQSEAVCPCAPHLRRRSCGWCSTRCIGAWKSRCSRMPSSRLCTEAGSPTVSCAPPTPTSGRCASPKAAARSSRTRTAAAGTTSRTGSRSRRAAAGRRAGSRGGARTARRRCCAAGCRWSARRAPGTRRISRSPSSPQHEPSTPRTCSHSWNPWTSRSTSPWTFRW